MASIQQIFIVLLIGWVAIFALGWQARDLFGKPKIKRYKVKKYKLDRYRRKATIYQYSNRQIKKYTY